VMAAGLEAVRVAVREAGRAGAKVGGAASARVAGWAGVVAAGMEAAWAAGMGFCSAEMAEGIAEAGGTHTWTPRPCRLPHRDDVLWNLRHFAGTWFVIT